MVRFAVRRLVLAVVSFITVTFLIWLFGVKYGQGIEVTHPTSYFSWLTGFWKGDWGAISRVDLSGIHFTPILGEIQNDLMPTLLLLIPAFLIQTLLAFSLGVFTAVRSGRVSRFASTLATILSAMPSFLVGALIIEYIGIIFGWLPAFYLYSYHSIAIAYGTPEFWAYVHAHLGEVAGIFARHLILPVLTLVLATYPGDSQLIRISMREVLSQDYIRAARAHGVPRWRITWGACIA